MVPDKPMATVQMSGLKLVYRQVLDTRPSQSDGGNVIQLQNLDKSVSDYAGSMQKGTETGLRGV